MVVVVYQPNKWTHDLSDPNFIHSNKPMFLWLISFIQVVPAGEEVHWIRDMPWDRCGRTWHGRPHLKGRPCLVVRPCLAYMACWFQFLPECVPAHKNHNTTRGTLLVPKMCMKLVVYASRT
jgi:hypothetical protein